MQLPKPYIVALVWIPAAAWYGHLHAQFQRQAAENEAARNKSNRLQLEVATSLAQLGADRDRCGLLETELARLTDALTAPKDAPPLSAPASASAPQAPAASMEGSTVALSKTNLHQLSLRPLTRDHRLTDAAAAVLGMSAAERTAVDDALGTLVRRHEALDLAKVQSIEEHLTSAEGRKTTFRVPAYPEEGKALAETFLGSLQQVLGEERSRLLVGYADLDSISTEGFEPFGRAEKTITFLDRSTAEGTRGDCQILMKLYDPIRKITLSTSFANVDDAIPVNWRHLVRNLDPGP